MVQTELGWSRDDQEQSRCSKGIFVDHRVQGFQQESGDSSGDREGGGFTESHAVLGGITVV